MPVAMSSLALSLAIQRQSAMASVIAQIQGSSGKGLKSQAHRALAHCASLPLPAQSREEVLNQIDGFIERLCVQCHGADARALEVTLEKLKSLDTADSQLITGTISLLLQLARPVSARNSKANESITNKNSQVPPRDDKDDDEYKKLINSLTADYDSPAHYSDSSEEQSSTCESSDDASEIPQSKGDKTQLSSSTEIDLSALSDDVFRPSECIIDLSPSVLQLEKIAQKQYWRPDLKIETKSQLIQELIFAFSGLANFIFDGDVLQSQSIKHIEQSYRAGWRKYLEMVNPMLKSILYWRKIAIEDCGNVFRRAFVAQLKVKLREVNAYLSEYERLLYCYVHPLANTTHIGLVNFYSGLSKVTKPFVLLYEYLEVSNFLEQTECLFAKAALDTLRRIQSYCVNEELSKWIDDLISPIWHVYVEKLGSILDGNDESNEYSALFFVSDPTNKQEQQENKSDSVNLQNNDSPEALVKSFWIDQNKIPDCLLLAAPALLELLNLMRVVSKYNEQSYSRYDQIKREIQSKLIEDCRKICIEADLTVKSDALPLRSGSLLPPLIFTASGNSCPSNYRNDCRIASFFIQKLLLSFKISQIRSTLRLRIEMVHELLLRSQLEIHWQEIRVFYDQFENIFSVKGIFLSELNRSMELETFVGLVRAFDHAAAVSGGVSMRCNPKSESEKVEKTAIWNQITHLELKAKVRPIYYEFFPQNLLQVYSRILRKVLLLQSTLNLIRTHMSHDKCSQIKSPVRDKNNHFNVYLFMTHNILSALLMRLEMRIIKHFNEMKEIMDAAVESPTASRLGIVQSIDNLSEGSNFYSDDNKLILKLESVRKYIVNRATNALAESDRYFQELVNDQRP